MSLNVPITDWRTLRVWLIGASSGIGAALATALLARGAHVALSARRADRLAEFAAASHAHPGAVLVLPADATDSESLAAAWAELQQHWGGCDVVFHNAGTHVPMRAWEIQAEHARDLINTNLIGAFNVLALVVPYFHQQRRGGIALMGSVAGYRGLPTGLIYGASKAALINVAETLYLDLAPRRVNVWLVNPGFVKTPLTEQNPFPMPALISSERAAQEILRGMERGQFEIHFPKRFTRLMKILRCLPDGIYFWLVHRFTGL